MNNQNNTLFFLSQCPTCQNFRIQCQKYNLLCDFNLICIDHNKQYYIQKGLTKVPSIILKGSSQIISGSNCFEWLNQMIKLIEEKNKQQMYENYNNIYNQNMNNNIARPPPLIKNNNNNNNNEQTKLNGYNNNEMNGISDNYAYESETNNNAFPKNFQSKYMSTEIFTPPIEKTKIEKNKQNELTRKISQQRKFETNEYKKRIEKEHQDILNGIHNNNF